MNWDMLDALLDFDACTTGIVGAAFDLHWLGLGRVPDAPEYQRHLDYLQNCASEYGSDWIEDDISTVYETDEDIASAFYALSLDWGWGWGLALAEHPKCPVKYLELLSEHPDPDVAYEAAMRLAEAAADPGVEPTTAG